MRKSEIDKLSIKQLILLNEIIKNKLAQKRKKRDYYIKNKPKNVEGKYIVVKSSSNKIIAKKKFNPETYENDINNYKQYRDFRGNPSKTTTYGKSYRFKSGTVVQYRELNKETLKGKGVSDEDKYSEYVIYCDGFTIRNGIKVPIHASSMKHPLGYPKEKAYEEAIYNFNHKAKYIYKYEENENISNKLKVKTKDDKTVIEEMYISYKR